MGLSSETLELPMDLVTDEILTRLPAKSLMRFKCVSKHWLSVICSKYFSNRFLTVPAPRLYLSLRDLNDKGKSVILSLAPSSSSSTTPSSFVVDHDLTIPRMGGNIVQFFRGFMCYIYRSRAHIYNPATRQLVTLPFINSRNMIVPRGGDKVVYYYFGHDPINDQYKVVSLISVYSLNGAKVMSKNWVFDLKAGGGGSWREAALTPPEFSPHQLAVRGGVCIDGVIYYVVYVDYKAVVVSFDVRSEEFNMIQIPPRDGDEDLRRTLDWSLTQNLSILEHGGKVTLFDQTILKDKGVLALWTLEDVRSKKWSCKSQTLKLCQMHLISNIKFLIRGTTQKGALV
ncbi:unnamed protein product [Thlaspi arvense]|uniref:F-box domain-containing protein n=1 Tax=Thlaspi arvense TaxID=13288 RepID=A0AAU9RHI7_THLAR|nr:unnamed protein product [Thlaspi arvense]